MEQEDKYGSYIVDNLYNSIKSFIVIGLCGRTGSGCSTVRDILSSDFESLALPPAGNELHGSVEEAEYKILYDYAKENWTKFYEIKVARLLTGYLLTQKKDELKNYIHETYLVNTLSDSDGDEVKGAIDAFFETKMTFLLPQYFLDALKSRYGEGIGQKLGGLFSRPDSCEFLFDLTSSEEPPEQTGRGEKKDVYSFKALGGHRDEKTKDGAEPEGRKSAPNQEKDGSETEIEYTYHYNAEKGECAYYFKLCDMQRILEIYERKRKAKIVMNNELVYWLLFDYAFAAQQKESKELWNKIGKVQKGLPTMILQSLGNILRTHGSLIFPKKNSEITFEEDGFTCIAKRINVYLKLLRDYTDKCQYYADCVARWEAELTGGGFRGGETEIAEELQRKRRACRDIREQLDALNKRVVVVIDTIKNPFESMYLKARYSSYYLMAIYADEDERLRRLESGEKKLTRAEIDTIAIVEQLNRFKEYIGRNDDGEKEDKLVKNADQILARWKQKDLRDVLPFIMQNVDTCTESADIFINNKRENSQRFHLKRKLIRYVSLIMNPGLVLPTPVERCMQIAQAAKVNSGCISRQVGAVVTDSEYRIRSVGWNEVPSGRIPCIYRDIVEVEKRWNPAAYSDFENDDEDVFQQNIKEPVNTLYSRPEAIRRLRGKRQPYCFKDVYNQIKNNKNQIHPRALHAEERAFLSLADQGGAPIAGGYLFTTSSPCELCSKKACYLGIAKVYYVEPYSGISFKHVFSDGAPEKRPVQELFTGALGRAYTQLYTPVMPRKDELELLLGYKLNGRGPEEKTEREKPEVQQKEKKEEKDGNSHGEGG